MPQQGPLLGSHIGSFTGSTLETFKHHAKRAATRGVKKAMEHVKEQSKAGQRAAVDTTVKETLRMFGLPDVSDPISSRINYFLEGDYMARRGYKSTSKRLTRRRKRYTKKSRIGRTLVPNTKLVKLRVVRPDTLTSSTTAARHVIRATDITDPFAVGSTGEQPLGFDQMKALYDKFKVLGTRVSVKFHSESSTEPVIVGITVMPPNAGGTALTSYSHYMEAPNTKSRIMSPDVDHLNIVSKSSVKKMLGLKSIRDEDELEGDLSSATPPSDLYYYHVWSQAHDETTSVNVSIVMTVDYIVLLSDRIVPSRSVV